MCMCVCMCVCVCMYLKGRAWHSMVGDVGYNVTEQSRETQWCAKKAVYN